MTTCKTCRFAGRTPRREERFCSAQRSEVRSDQGACPAYAISARAYLEQIGSATRRMEDMSYRAQRYRDMACRATGSMEAVRISGTSRHSRVETSVIGCLDLAADIDRRAAALRAQYETACEMIESVQNVAGRELLELRYLRGMRWEDIGRRLGYELRQVYRLHGRALQEIQAQMTERKI